MDVYLNLGRTILITVVNTPHERFVAYFKTNLTSLTFIYTLLSVIPALAIHSLLFHEFELKSFLRTLQFGLYFSVVFVFVYSLIALFGGDDETEYEISDEALRVRYEGIEKHFDWSHLIHVEENARYFSLSFIDGDLFLIPTKAIEEQDKLDLRKCFKAGLGDDAKLLTN